MMVLTMMILMMIEEMMMMAMLTTRVHRLHTQLCQRLRDTAPPPRATGHAHDRDKRYGSVDQVHAEGYGDRRPAEAYSQREVAPQLDHR